jgi:sulfite reductase beta subunit-like hemoprotein
MFLALADIAERYGDGMLCLTPWRAVLLPKVAERDQEPLRIAAEASGLIADSADPSRNISACPGKPACASASVEARADAEVLAVSGIARDLHIHVSGCAKGCAHRAPAPVTLVGQNGTYALVRHGRAWDEPALRNLTIAQAIAALRTLPESLAEKASTELLPCHAREGGHPVNTSAEDPDPRPTFTGSSAFAEDDKTGGISTSVGTRPEGRP